MAKSKDKKETSAAEETATPETEETTAGTTEGQAPPPEPPPPEPPPVEKVDVTHIQVNRAAFYRLINALVKRQPEAYIGHAAIGKLSDLLELGSYAEATTKWQEIRDILG